MVVEKVYEELYRREKGGGTSRGFAEVAKAFTA